MCTCRICRPDKGYLDIDEAIVRIVVNEILDENGCKFEEMVINDKWRIVPTGNPEHPFRREEIEKVAKEKVVPEIPYVSLETLALDRIHHMGRAHQMLNDILEEDIFQRAAFDESWTSDHEDSDLKLDALRIKLMEIEQKLIYVKEILSYEIY